MNISEARATDRRLRRCAKQETRPIVERDAPSATPEDANSSARTRSVGGSRNAPVERNSATAEAPRRLHVGLSESAQLRRALAASRRQTEAAREEVASLAAQVARLTQEMTRLTRLEARARRLAYRDELTGLPNRRVLLDRLRQAIAQSTRHGRFVALLMLDVDGFKTVNDRLGHTIGDALLQVVADRLVNCVRAGDTVCRYGGDEFVVLLPDIVNRGAALAAERNIRVVLSAPYDIDGARITEQASIGAAVFPADGRASRALIAHADAAMYQDKADRQSPVTSRSSPRRRVSAP